jgi:integrase
MSKREHDQSEKQPRRVRGEGSVFQRADGRWVVSVPLGDGRKRIEYVDDKKQAERARRRILREIEEGRLVTGRDQHFNDYLSYWLGVQKETLKKGTYSTYSRYLMKRVAPALGQVKLQNLTGTMFQSLYAKWRKEGMSANTIRLIHTILKKALDDAVMWRKLAINPVRDAEPPRKEERDMQVLDVTQAQKLLEVAKGTRLDCLLHLALLGLRRGELLGLRWQDINFEKRELRISRSLSYVQDPETGLHEFVLDTPKTASSRRVLTLPQFILDSLYEHRAAQQEIQAHVHRWQNLDIVFCTRFGGYMIPNGMVNDFDKLLKKASLPDIRFHDLRHSAATIWIALGVSPNVIRELLGHRNIVTTLGIYGHVLPTMHQQAIDHLDELFSKKPDEGDIK